MTADAPDDFPYRPDERVADEAARRHYWAVAIGLQQVDGLEVSPYLRELAEGNVRGEYTLAETGRLIRAYHGVDDVKDQSSHGIPADETAGDTNPSAVAGLPGESSHNGESRVALSASEADLVSQRIAELLADGAFTLAPSVLPHIHRTLFQDLDAQVYLPGQYKTERLVKQEDILNGDSVLYADPSMIEPSLDFLFREEARAVYGAPLASDDVARLAKFVALLWQVHPFVEGNTRTTAVFSELYLNHLGVSVDNDPFQEHARFYRDALVRANYRNNNAGIAPDMAPLQAFYESLVLGTKNPFDREDLVCPALLEHPELLRNVPPSQALRQNPTQS